MLSQLVKVALLFYVAKRILTLINGWRVRAQHDGLSANLTALPLRITQAMCHGFIHLYSPCLFGLLFYLRLVSTEGWETTGMSVIGVRPVLISFGFLLHMLILVQSMTDPHSIL